MLGCCETLSRLVELGLKAKTAVRPVSKPGRMLRAQELATKAIENIIDANSGRKVAVVCHGGVINFYMAHVIRVDRRVFFEPAYTSINRILAARSGERSVQSLNEVAHLRNTGLLLA